SIEAERVKREAPHDQDRHQHQEIRGERRDVGAGEPRVENMEAHDVRENPTRRDDAGIAGQQELLEKLAVRLQHQCTASRAARYALTRSLNTGRSKVSARRLSALGSKRPGSRSKSRMASIRSSTV